MAYSKGSKSAAVRARLDHPVIDGDGHWLEPIPIFLDYLRDVGRRRRSSTSSSRRRQGRHLVRPGARGAHAPPAAPADLVGRAGQHARPRHRDGPAPVLRAARRLRHRLLPCSTPRSGLFYVGNPDEEIRRARRARGEPDERRDVHARIAHRITPAAVVPVHTPEEAIEEATYAVRELGLKVRHDRQPRAAAGARRFAREGDRRPTRRGSTSTRSASRAPTTTTRSGSAASI